MPWTLGYQATSCSSMFQLLVLFLIDVQNLAGLIKLRISVEQETHHACICLCNLSGSMKAATAMIEKYTKEKRLVFCSKLNLDSHG